MIFVFRTKNASFKFLEAFANNSEHQVKIFKNIENEGEEFYNYSWPDFEMNNDVEFCFQGLIRGSEKLKPYMKTNRWYYFDQPYFYCTDYKNHNDFGDQWYRINVNDVQTNKISDNQKHLDRYNKLLNTSRNEIQLKKWKKSGDHILVVPPSYHTAKWYDIDEEQWIKDTVKDIKKHTDRPVRVRYKYKNGVKFGDRVDKDNPLQNDLRKCHAIVSFHSMCASHAVREGVPSFCSEYSPAAPVSLLLDQLDKIENPIKPDRERWMATLLGSQFTLSEMKSGFAYRYLND